ncbi:DUF4214 domain-containing protein [Sphingomonas glacialis]|uniref:DUF4214 domain-containing protein n=1 Tax=Sphingomonas glacialis TaxID=658225 RepID=A0A502FQA2_9SPHN|nr:DUF4214 domain-containing protein [Sphingomonas glacialis]TPG51625.1 DUF4214 domain-containing protein [Sphingomonas glacialis]
MKSGFDALQSLNPVPTLSMPLSQEFIDSMTSIEKILQWHDTIFVEIAYHVMLQRPADTAGSTYYVDRLRRGRSRIEVLDQLGKSPEASPLLARVKGLEAALKAYRASRPLFAGFWRRWKDPEIGNRAAFARARAMTNSLERTRQEIILAFGDLLAAQRDLSLLVSRQSVAPAASTESARTIPVSHVPRVVTIADVREIDFHSNERRVFHALRV